MSSTAKNIVIEMAENTAQYNRLQQLLDFKTYLSSDNTDHQNNDQFIDIGLEAGFGSDGKVISIK